MKSKRDGNEKRRKKSFPLKFPEIDFRAQVFRTKFNRGSAFKPHLQSKYIIWKASNLAH